MRRAVAMILALEILTTGCGGIHYVDVTDEATPLGDINRALENKNAAVLLKEGTRLRVQHLELRADSTAFLPLAPRAQEEAIATSRIETIEVMSRSRGGVIGGLFGMACGLVAAAATAANDDMSMGMGDAITLGTLFGLAGGAAGAVLGSVIGDQQVYAIWVGGPLPRQQDK